MSDFNLFIEKVRDELKLEDLIFKGVEINKKKNYWILNFFLKEAISAAKFKILNEKIKEYKTPDYILMFCNFKYGKNELSMEEYINYFSYFIDLLANYRPRYQTFSACSVKFNNNTYYVSIDDSTAYLKDDLQKLYDQIQYAGFNCDVILENANKDNYDNDLIPEGIFEKEAEPLVVLDVVDKIFAKPSEEEKKASEVVIKPSYATKWKSRALKAIDEKEIVSIKKIPIAQIELMEYERVNGTVYFTIKGECFSVEVKKMRNNSYLLLIKVTDGKDSIFVKKFLNAADEALKEIKVGNILVIVGKAQFDTFERDVVIMADNIKFSEKPEESFVDKSDEKRVELHAHTHYSNMDALPSVKDYFKRAKDYGHEAIAFTDHAGVYAFPDIFKVSKDFPSIKPIYGSEFEYVEQECIKIALEEQDLLLKEATYTVFDIETSGFSINYHKIIEIAAVKVHNGLVLERFQRLIKIDKPLTEKIIGLTNISDEMLKEEGFLEEEVIKEFYEFIQDTILVGHNVGFDLGHVYNAFKRYNLDFKPFPAIDTLQLSRLLYENDIKRNGLKYVCKFLKVSLDEHHRAFADAKATSDILTIMLDNVYARNVFNHKDLNKLAEYKNIHKYHFPKHINVLVQNNKGLKNLYKILSLTLTRDFFSGQRLRKDSLLAHREGFLVGSACVNGLVFENALNKDDKMLEESMKFFDYIEIQPKRAVLQLKDELGDEFEEIYEDVIKRIIKIAEKNNILVVATGDCHYLDEEDLQFRNIFLKTPQIGGGLHKLSDVKNIPVMAYLSTDKMCEEFSFLDKKKAKEIVIDNSKKIADLCERIQVFPKEAYFPKDDFLRDVEGLSIKSVKDDLLRIVYEKAQVLYGNIIPDYVKARLDRELESIIKHNFSPIYYMSYLLVQNSIKEGYLVGSRGSVGSSLVATLMEITEVNPLVPHYLCPNCKFTSFKLTEEERKKYPLSDKEIPLQENLKNVLSGYDLKKALCPVCNKELIGDGHDIPFETFLGFDADKTPDIDLNFSGDYQSKAHDFIRNILGEDNAFRSGTVSTIQSKTAYGYVKGFLEKNGEILRGTEIERIARHIEGVKRSTGQHPGGIIVVPKENEIYDITPIQYPADDISSSWRTTHFDYHSFEDNLLKLDILGHDDPTVIKFIMDYVKTHPKEFPFSDPRDIPVSDPKVYELFSKTDVIGCKPERILTDVASYGVPELGTNFVRNMLSDTKPTTFADLVKISGLSHGTDVWTNNAQSLVNSTTRFGKIPFGDIIACRDDIMIYLMKMGVLPKTAFTIMEYVRKYDLAKPAKAAKWPEYVAEMQKNNVPDWYIWSCANIKYLFPKAHATAYVLMAMRIAWFKVYKPILFYSAYFSKRAEQFDYEAMLSGYDMVYEKIIELKPNLGKGIKEEVKKEDEEVFEVTKTQEDKVTVLLVALEMLERNLGFLPVDINKSDPKNFLIVGNKLLFPLTAISGLGQNVALNIVEKRNERPFTSASDVKERCKINKTVFEYLMNMGTFENLDKQSDWQETDDGTLF